MGSPKGLEVQAKPVWIERSVDRDEAVQFVVHPETGKWWFRHLQRSERPVFVRNAGGFVYVYAWTSWECPENQPQAPWRNARRVRKPSYARLPSAYPPPPRRSRGRPKKEKAL